MDTDPQIHAQIEQLVAEEHGLWRRESVGNGATPTGDACSSSGSRSDHWDLLRQRRAQREAGRDPGAADMRRAEVVERYEQ